MGPTLNNSDRLEVTQCSVLPESRPFGHSVYLSSPFTLPSQSTYKRTFHSLAEMGRAATVRIGVPTSSKVTLSILESVVFIGAGQLVIRSSTFPFPVQQGRLYGDAGSSLKVEVRIRRGANKPIHAAVATEQHKRPRSTECCANLNLRDCGVFNVCIVVGRRIL